MNADSAKEALIAIVLTAQIVSASFASRAGVFGRLLHGSVSTVAQRAVASVANLCLVPQRTYASRVMETLIKPSFISSMLQLQSTPCEWRACPLEALDNVGWPRFDGGG